MRYVTSDSLSITTYGPSYRSDSFPTPGPGQSPELEGGESFEIKGNSNGHVEQKNDSAMTESFGVYEEPSQLLKKGESQDEGQDPLLQDLLRRLEGGSDSLGSFFICC